MYIQQGDVILTKCELPIVVDEIKGNVIHQGDNHSHTIDGDFKLLKAGNDFFVCTNSICTLEHCEHGRIEKKYRTITEGIYKKSIVLEYDHFTEESKEVID
jgi:hypothetical protein